ncbi:MAG TPA: DMT family transporter [Bacteroidota bacterium]|nr:DMT family transporter [Bacteroidota bacterium]
MNRLKGYAFILGATLFWGVAATAAKFLFTRNYDTLVLVQMRMTISCLLLLAWFVLFKRKFLAVKARDLWHFAALGLIGGAGSNFTYYFTIRQTNVATAILLQYLAPLLVLLWAAVSGEEKLTKAKLAAGAVSLAGCYLAIAGRDFSVLSINRLGLVSGLASAFCWGFTNVFLRHLVKRYNVWTCLLYAFIFSSLLWIVINPPWKIAAAGYDARTWGTFLVFAVISILIPHSLYFGGIRYLTASRAIITATFEPIVAIASSFVILGESLAPVQIAGAVLVVSAIAILQIRHGSEPDTGGAAVTPVGHSVAE